MKENKIFSRALFKQSCKANGIMWIIITVAVCFMLACVMLISGTSSISSVKEGVEDTIIEQTINAQIKKSAVSEYVNSYDGETLFDEEFVKEFKTLNTTSNADLYLSKAKEEGSEAAFKEVYIVPCYTSAAKAVVDKYGNESSSIVTINPNNQADSIYTQYNEAIPAEYVSAFTTYMTADVLGLASGSDTLSTYISSDERTSFKETRAYNATSMLVAGKMSSDETIETLLETLKDYGVTKEKYLEMGFDYTSVHKTSYESSLEYQEKLNYEISLLDSTSSDYAEKIKEVKENLSASVSGSLLEKLPTDVADGIKELGQMDLYGLIVGSIFFKMAGLLLPIIYLIMVSNNLVAGQVDSGSMAYVLSTSTKRNQVTFTQGLFLVLSLFLMFVCTAITSIVCFEIADVNTELTVGKLLLINLGAFVVLFALSGINFLASCWFDRSKKAMAIGGGLSMFFLVATMLGLFGSHVIPSVVRIGALNNFNYVSLISLFDVVSILDGTKAWIWKLAILLVIGIAGYVIGSVKFKKKDLPL